MASSPPTLRTAINRFVIAYNPRSHVLLEYWPTTRTEHFGLSVCDEAWDNWGGVGCASLEEALDVGERFRDAPRREWVIVGDDIEPWRAPAAREFERKRLTLLAELRRRLADVD